MSRDFSNPFAITEHTRWYTLGGLGAAATVGAGQALANPRLGAAARVAVALLAGGLGSGAITWALRGRLRMPWRRALAIAFVVCALCLAFGAVKGP